MNKMLITLALAGTMAAPHIYAGDDTVVYGRAKMNLTSATEMQVSGDQRLGFKGGEDLGNGMTAIYKLEFAILNDSNGAGGIANREQSVGVSGDFGTIKIGNLPAPFYAGASGAFDIGNIADARQNNGGNGGRVGDAIGYWNSFGAVKLGVTYGTLDGTGAAEDLEVSLNFDAGPLKIGVAMQDTGVTGADTITGLGIIYGMDNFSVGLQFTSAAETASMLQARYFAGANSFFIQLGSAPDPSDASPMALGVQHNMSKRTRVYLEMFDPDTTADSTVGVGMRHDF